MRMRLDGRTAEFEGSPTVLEVARANGVDIPSLCDCPGLEPFAACRLCLVEVAGRKGYVPACHTPAEDGLEVRTETPELQALRRGILELILAEHPHACLVCAEKASCDEYKSTIRKTGEVTGCVLCPANGRCRLQRVAEAVGVGPLPFSAARREGEVRRDDPFIDRDNSLCILCGRCVRVCQEVRGAAVLTFAFRGSRTVVGAAQDRRLADSGCRFCGACVDVCPTGSLADRGLRYEPLLDAEKPVVCPLCAQGCRLRLGLRDGRLLGSAPDAEGPANAGQACVKGRFLVRFAVRHGRRRLRPMVRRDGKLRECSWDEALAAAAAGLASAGAGGTAVAGSAQSSCEDLYVLQRFAAALKAPAAAGTWFGSTTAALRDLAAAAGAGASLNFRYADVGRAGVVIQLGGDLPETQPILAIEVHRAARNGAVIVGPGNPGGKEGTLLAALKAVRPRREKLRGLAEMLRARRPAFILFGREFLQADSDRRLRRLIELAARAGARLLPLETEANLRGAVEVAAAFAATTEADHGRARALYLAGPTPIPPGPERPFVILQGPYREDGEEAADVVLPEATAFETEGTFVNAEGRAQLSTAALEPAGEARPGWRIVAELARRMGAPGFDYGSAADVRTALAAGAPAFRGLAGLGSSPEGIFLDDAPAGGVGFQGRGAAPGKAVEGAALPTPPDPDDYRGLCLDLESKSLRLVRGR